MVESNFGQARSEFNGLAGVREKLRKLQYNEEAAAALVEQWDH